jgi:flavin reductase (DIM6/NTAB) family NADH-FMN oxidoreductase RutF
MTEGAETKSVVPAKARDVLDLLPPFPIVLVTTRSNIITIGQLHYFTFEPLRIGVAVAHTRYTYGLLKEEGEFVVNVPGSALLNAVKLCGSVSGRNQDKFAAAGLTRAPSCQVQAVSIRECGAHIECRVDREVAFEERTWFVGRVIAARKRADHHGAEALLCGRTHYAVANALVAPR